jgi:pimeloyl-ACP methyl ester carboxylesterase
MNEQFLERDDGATVWASAVGPHDDVGADRPALLILDGIGCAGWAFRRIVPELAARYRVIQLHYRGHGRSPVPPRPWRLSMPDLADDAAAVLAQLAPRADGASPCAIAIGFSMGFQVALELYRRHRPQVAGLVSLAGPASKALAQFQGTDVFGQVLPLVRAASKRAKDLTVRLWRRVLPSRWLPLVGLHTQLHPMRIELGDLEFYLRQMSEIDPELFLEMLGEAARHTAEDLLPAIRVPTLVIAGAHDRFVPIDTLRKLAFATPTAQWLVIDDGSHALPAEYPTEIAARLLAFADSVTSG